MAEQMTRGPRVQLSGPVTGVPRAEAEAAFASAAAWAADALGAAEVYDPTAEIDPRAARAEAMRACVEALLRADALVMLPGWESSEGARLERAVAEAIGTEVLIWEP